MKTGLGCLLAGMLLVPLGGQVVARQGTPADVQSGRFTSPMVIELPMDKLRLGELEDIYTFTDQAGYICDDVSLPLVVVRKSVDLGAKRVKLRIESTVYVRPSFDRKVMLRYSITKGGQALDAVTEQEISAKEKKYRSDSSTLVLSKEAFDGLFDGPSHGVLKVVMTVAPDR